MRVLWFSTNSACYSSSGDTMGGYNGGGWMSSLQKEIMQCEDITLGVSFCMDAQPWKTVQNGTIYYPVPYHRKSLRDKLLDFIHLNDVSRDRYLWKHYIEHYKRVINDFKPDVIEVFGSELYTGLASVASKELHIPCCLHIQGILSLYFYTYLVPGLSEWKYYFSDGIKGAYGRIQYLAYWKRSCYRERAILNATPHVIGRTEWDRHAMKILAPQAEYHYGGEILRPTFYRQWNRNLPSTPVITTTISDATYKGLDLLLKIAQVLKNVTGTKFLWQVYGNINPKTAEHLTHINHKDVGVELCGVADETTLCEALLHSTLYCHTSYIENSANSIAEAQMLGLPIVATNVGGTSSMVAHDSNGYLFPATDPYTAAYYITKLIKDTELNITMGSRGKADATKRHDKKEIISQLIRTYKEISTPESII